MPDDLSHLDVEFQRRLKRFIAQERGDEPVEPFWKPVIIKEEPLDDSWFWPDDKQPMPREKSNQQLEPFWR